MTHLFTSLIAQGSLSSNLVYFLLVLPVIGALVAFARQVVGVTMFGAYAPIIAVYAFIGSGLGWGLLLCLLVLLSELLVRYTTRSLRLHFLPKTSLLISIVAIVVLVFVVIAAYIPITLTSLAPLSLVLFILLGDIYLTVQTQQGYRHAVTLYIETVAVAVIVFLLISWSGFRYFLLNYPEVIILAIAADLFIGRWKGLRLVEVYRFRSVIKEKAKDYA
jgi:hypothetical protein